jgi:DNA-directed RNA polymerase beta subunit
LTNGLTLGDNNYNLTVEHVSPHSQFKQYIDTYTARFNITENTPFLSINIPQLIQDTFFIINKIHYIPAIYMIDEPITVKMESIQLQSLFCPITISCKDKKVTIMQTNISLKKFLQFVFQNDVDEEYSDAFEFNNPIQPEDDKEILSVFAKLLNDKPDYKILHKKLNSLIFDHMTYNIYHKVYNIIPDITTIVKLAISKMAIKKPDDFINLNYKRLIFIEALLRPYFKAISSAMSAVIRNTIKIKYLTAIKQDSIIDNFMSSLGLQANFYYDITNGYTSLLAHKASFKSPFVQKKLPLCVSNIHPTHKGRICPITVKNTDPGVNVSLTPTIKIDYVTGLIS